MTKTKIDKNRDSSIWGNYVKKLNSIRDQELKDFKTKTRKKESSRNTRFIKDQEFLKEIFQSPKLKT